MKKKIQLIDKICENHPAYGVEKGWSYYIGGMKDSGDWYFRKMLDIPLKELQEFYDKIEEEKNRPKVPLTGKEKNLQKQVIYFEGGKYWMNLLEYTKLQEWEKQKQLDWLFYEKEQTKIT